MTHIKKQKYMTPFRKKSHRNRTINDPYVTIKDFQITIMNILKKLEKKIFLKKNEVLFLPEHTSASLKPLCPPQSGHLYLPHF